MLSDFTISLWVINPNLQIMSQISIINNIIVCTRYQIYKSFELLTSNREKMKLLIVLVLGILCYSQTAAQLANYMHLFNNHREPPAPKIQSTSRAVTEGFITQRLDNFNAADARTFQAVM
jgi:hypothetical protein